MARGSKLNVADVVKMIKGISGKAKKAVDLGKGAYEVYKKVKSAAGTSACKDKKCSTKEKIMDIGSRVVKGGKALLGEKENIKNIYESGKRLAKVGGVTKMSQKPEMQKKSAPARPSGKPSMRKSENIPAAPPAPPAPAPSSSKSEIQSKPMNGQRQSMSRPNNAALMEQIRAGKQLKKTKGNNQTMGNNQSWQELLKQRMAEMRPYIR
jgi:hypothetical protein